MKFFQGLKASACYEVQVLSRLLARDMQSVTGKNLNLIKEMTTLDPWLTSKGRLKAALQEQELVAIPEIDKWRLPYLCSLLSQRSNAHFLAFEAEESRLTDLINSLVIN